MKKNHLLSIFCLLFLTALTGCQNKGGSPSPGAAKGGRGGGPVPVTAVTVGRKDVPLEIQVIGNVEAYSTITVKAQVGGQLEKVHFSEGDYVKKNDLLFEIDRRSYEAQYRQAEAALARAAATLGQAQANLARDLAQEKYAQAQAARYAKLTEEGVISREQNDQVRTSADALSQSVTADRAAMRSADADIAAAKATMENIKVLLDYTSIRSPIDGRTGNLMVKQGNVVNANSMDLMTINQVQPVYVTFSIPEVQLRQVKKYMAVGKLPVTATPQDEEAGAETGYLTFVDNAVDSSTGMIKLKATFGNAERKLWPGEFVRVVLRLTTQSNAVVVPNQAVQTGQEGQFVYLIKQDQTVEARGITTGARVGQELVVENGLEGGESVVTEGQLRLAPGSRVQLQDRSRQGGGRGRPKS